MKRVILYSTARCPYCQIAKRYLEQQGIRYRLCDVNTAKGRKEFSTTGLQSVPVLKVGEQLMKGFSVKQFKKLYD